MAKKFYGRVGQEVKKEAECIEKMAFPVKAEPKWMAEGDAAALAELYAGHVVKDELVIGPDILQERNVDFSICAKIPSSKTELLETSKQHIFHEFNHDEKVKISLIKLEENDDEIKSECNSNHEAFDDSFNNDHVNISAAKCTITEDEEKTDSKKPDQNEREILEAFGSSFLDENFDFRPKFVESKINFNIFNLPSAEGTRDFKEHIKRKLFPIEHSRKENTPAENQSKNTNTDNTYARQKKDKEKTNYCETKENDNGKRYKHSIKEKKCANEDKGDERKKKNTDKNSCSTNKNKCDIKYERNDLCCKTCKKSFVSQVNLIRHKQIHEGSKPYICKICNKEFARIDYLKTHEKIHLENKLYKCEYCPKQFSDRSNYNRHTRYHKGQKLYTCETCGKQFGQKIHLVTHKVTHAEKKPYTCDTCLKQFTYKHRLIAHKRVHSSEKPFSCQICPKRFVAKCRLTRHEILIHGAKLPYVCDLCKKEFDAKKDITKHVTDSH